MDACKNVTMSGDKQFECVMGMVGAAQHHQWRYLQNTIIVKSIVDAAYSSISGFDRRR